MYIRDTIAAISTPIGEGGIAIIRISGDDALHTASTIFRKPGNGGLTSHRFYYGTIINPDGSVVDEVMLVFMKGPRSYTREDVIEIQCHGGYLITRQILDLVLRTGARLADPGEFTKRAFLNGRIDLLQAEAVIDLIRGKTETAVAVAHHQRQGLLSQRFDSVRHDIVQALALVEAWIDFPEEDIDVSLGDSLADIVNSSLRLISEFLEGYREGRILREGVSVVLVGKPNVGKSSLLNSLLREKRAIVTSIPGTTRDIIEEVVNISGLPVRIVDSAGIRATDDEVEREGVLRTLAAIEQADLILLLVDRSAPFTAEDAAIVEGIVNKPIMVVKTKKDLPDSCSLPSSLLHFPVAEVSTIANEGIDSLRDAIFSTFIQDSTIDSREFVAVSQARHRDALLKAKAALETSVSGFQVGFPLEIVAADLRGALNAIGEITGETTPDDVLDVIFSNFCIGK